MLSVGGDNHCRMYAFLYVKLGVEKERERECERERQKRKEIERSDELLQAFPSLCFGRLSHSHLTRLLNHKPCPIQYLHHHWQHACDTCELLDLSFAFCISSHVQHLLVRVIYCSRNHNTLCISESLYFYSTLYAFQKITLLTKKSTKIVSPRFVFAFPFRISLLISFRSECPSTSRQRRPDHKGFRRVRFSGGITFPEIYIRIRTLIH